MSPPPPPPPSGKQQFGSFDARPHLQAAQAAQQRAQWGEALKCYERVLAVDAGHVAACCGQAEALMHTGQLARGLVVAQQAVNAYPKQAGCWITLSKLQQAVGEVEKGLESANSAAEFQPGQPASAVEQARCLQSLHRLGEAMEAIDRAIELNPDDLFPRSIKADILVAGKEDRLALELLEEILNSADLYPGLARRAWHSLGLVHDRLGDYGAALLAFRKCGELTAQSSRAGQCNPQAQPHLMGIIKEGFTADRLVRFVDDGSKQWAVPAPAFLVGFPRSGTTMTEQILAAHGQIRTSDERPYLNAVRAGWAKRVGGSNDVGAMIARTTAQHVVELRQLYWEKVASGGGAGPNEGAGIFLDKLPLNIINLGLINLVFPDAKVLVALRDPRDVCLSCFMQDFRLNNSMIHFLTLAETSKFYAQVMDLYLHFRQIISLDCLELRYEDTVADLERQTRRALDLLGLGWDDDVLRFHEGAARRAISTPSSAAVTEPVHGRAVQRWKNYADAFAALEGDLGRYIKEFDYE